MRGTSRLLACVCLAVLGLGFAACSSDPPSAPTPVDPGAPKLTCATVVTQASSSGSPVAVVYPLPTVTGGQPPLIGPTCNPPTGSLFPVGQSTVACSISDAKGRSDLCTVVITVTPPPPKLLVTRLLAFGDSITWGEDGQNASTAGVQLRRVHPSVQLTGQTYPDDLQASLDARYPVQLPTVLNDGLVGEQASSATAFTRFSQATSSRAFDVALIMEGANDLAASVGFSTIIGALGRMIDQARSVNVRPFLATIPPENPDPACIPICRGGEAPVVPAFNAQVRLLAASKGVPLVDVEQAFNGDLTLIGPDGLHPTAAGYQVIANTFFTVIRQNLEAALGVAGKKLEVKGKK